MGNSRFLLLVSLMVLCLLPSDKASAATDPVSAEWVERWRQDLSAVETEMPELHPNLFHAVMPEEFESRIAQLKERVPSLAHHEIIVELARIIASFEDGHTRLTLPFGEGVDFFQGHTSTPDPKDPAMLFRQYPIRFYLYSDGLFVRKIGADHAAAAGGRVLKIGTMTADAATAAVSEMTQHDNDMQLKALTPVGLAVPEVLDALGVIEDMKAAPLEIQSSDGTVMNLELHPVQPGETIEWVDARSTSDSATPLYLRNTEKPYWFEYLENDQAVYFQYNEVTDDPEEPIRTFANRLFSFIESHPVEKLIIDLRWNGGGNNSLNQPLIHGLIRCRKLQTAGSLYTIVGRSTFSAAMMFALDIEKNTKSIFVGESTGARPNHYGDSRKLLLPQTGLTIRVSSLYWQYSDPRDQRAAIEPQIATPLASRDYRDNRDPAMAALFPDDSISPQLGGVWEGTISARYQQLAAKLEFQETEEGWAGTISVPDQRLQDVEVQELKSDTSGVSFQITTKLGVLPFRAKFLGKRMVGEMTVRNLEIPFVFKLHED